MIKSLAIATLTLTTMFGSTTDTTPVDAAPVTVSSSAKPRCPGTVVTVNYGAPVPCDLQSGQQLNVRMPGKWSLRRTVTTCNDMGGLQVRYTCRNVDF